ncbi:hypothetical protein COV04_02555 [Candidatus Uhrbacteria bacterium CG10_big_fil_rev_8_21_14_0_10_48_11]|uniref:Uncharacterized protein n=1 Tax=Candidatus Uhrbacteria bacterium CG10_big_fil_rev_8_21_14_0_10_48_11 TaxID=1975037 RepID=A0A2M8LEC5_9BACT|nr:MAG: hypothetical protein COV04_02555 [Candidatus Uhrbacteria bacterium CG10_big_fil_rev_8_21_14_0_10_48_11]
MSEEARTIAKNTTYLTTALVIQKAIAFLFFLLIAKLLGDVGTGEYVGAFAFSSLFSIGVDIGLAQVLVREIARSPERTEKFYRTTLGMKLVLGVLVYGALMATIVSLNYFGIPHPGISVVAIAGIIMMADSLVLTGTSIFRGWQNLWFESIVIIVQKIGVLAVGVAALFLFPSAFNVSVAILVGSLFSYVLLGNYLSRRVGQPWRPSFSKTTAKFLLRLAVPFAIAGVFSTAYVQLDSVLLSILQGNSAVGLYSVAAKTMNAFAFIPAAFVAALYPALSSFYVSAPDLLKRTVDRALRYLLIIGVPIAVGIYLLADNFVQRLGVSYGPSAEAVRILVPSLIFVFLSFPLGSLLNATNRQHWQTAIIGVSLAVNVVCNLFWIPAYSYLGASAAWFVSNACYFILDAVFASRVVRISWSTMFVSAIRVGLAAVIMGYIVSASLPALPLFAIVGLAAICYGFVLVLTREITMNDVRFLLGLMRRPVGGNVQPLPPEGL